MSLFTDLKEVLTPYAHRIKSLDGQVNGVNDSLTIMGNELHEASLFNDWTTFGTNSHPSGWIRGYVGASNGVPNAGGGVAPYYIRSMFNEVNGSRVGGAYKPDDDVVSFEVSAPDAYCVAAFEYDESGIYITRHGNQNSSGGNGTSSVTIQHTSGHTYVFSLGYFTNGDSADYVDNNTFLSGIVLTERRSKLPNFEFRISGTEELVGSIQSDVSNTVSVLNNKNTESWSHFGTPKYPLGWRNGYYRSSDGAINSSSNIAICTPGSMYTPPDGVKEFTIEVPDGFGVSVVEFDYDTGFQRSIGTFSQDAVKTKSVTIEPIENCYYKFSVGYFTGDTAGQYLNNEFINQIILTETYYAGTKGKEGNHLNILLFGNSYFADSWGYVPFILKKYGITSNIHFYYRGSGSVDRLVAEWEDDTETGLDDFDKPHVRRYSHIDTRYQKSWESVETSIRFSPKQVLEKVNNNPNFDKWDIIVMSAGSRAQSFTVAPGNGDPRKGAEPYIRQAINLINASYDKPYHLAWFGAYTSIDGYSGNESKGYPAIPASAMDNRVGVLKSTETIMSAEPFDMVIPAGTAIFNARTNTSLASISLSATGNLWCADKIHLHAGIPNYIANITVVQSIFKKFFPQFSIIGDDTRITDSLINSYNCPFIRSWCGNVLDDTELLYELGQKAAVLACEHPYDITPIYLPTDTAPLEWLDSHSDRYWADALIDTSNIG